MKKSHCWRCGTARAMLVLTLGIFPLLRRSLFCSSCGVRCSGHTEA